MQTRKGWQGFIVGALTLCAGMAAAQGYPAKPVRVISSGVGGGADIAARLLAPGLSEALGQQLVIDNRASGIIPGEVAARTSPDGYSLLFYNNTLWAAPLIQKTSYDAV